MRRTMRAVALLLVAVLALVVPASAVSDHGDPAISRLWTPGDPNRFTCTASYIYPRISEQSAWVVTAGHCREGVYLKRNASGHVVGVVTWSAVLENHNNFLGPTTDLALGTVPDVRDEDEQEYLWLAEEAPKQGYVYIHGFPAGVERVFVAYLVPDTYADQYTMWVAVDPWGGISAEPVTSVYENTRLMRVRRGMIEGGSSGSPVLNESGQVIGILWGLVTAEGGLQGPGADEYDIALFTPVERLRALMDLLGAKGT